MAILYPASLANLVVEVGTRHCHQTLLIELWLSLAHNYCSKCHKIHHNEVIMSAMVSQITSLTVVYSTVHSGSDQRKHQSSASLAFVWGIHRWLVNSPHKGPVTWKVFPFHDVIMISWDPICHFKWCRLVYKRDGIINGHRKLGEIYLTF